MSAARVPGDLSQPRHALSTLKHFIAYGASEGGQNGGSNLLGERELRETYLPPFEAAVKAGARSVMTAYNSVDGIPCTANRRMLTDILRGEWGFDGFVVSDLLSIEGLHETHGVAGSVREAAVQALRAGRGRRPEGRRLRLTPRGRGSGRRRPKRRSTGPWSACWP